MLLKALSSTTLTCLLDDPKMTESLGEFLLQLQSGLSQGSCQYGMKTPKGGVLMTTNSCPETERYADLKPQVIFKYFSISSYMFVFYGELYRTKNTSCKIQDLFGKIKHVNERAHNTFYKK